MENKDVSFITKDKSDPYCELQLGSQLLKTRTINNNLNPKFNEYFEAVVDQTTAQKLRIHLFDQDTAGKDEELGHLSIPMTFVEKNKVVSKVRKFPFQPNFNSNFSGSISNRVNTETST